jgi:hypothetical protein
MPRKACWEQLNGQALQVESQIPLQHFYAPGHSSPAWIEDQD